MDKLDRYDIRILDALQKNPDAATAGCQHFQPGAGRSYRTFTVPLLQTRQTARRLRLYSATGGYFKSQKAWPQLNCLRTYRHGSSHARALCQLPAKNCAISRGAGVQSYYGYGSGLSAQSRGARHGPLPEVFTRIEGVTSVRSSFVLDQIRSSTELPLEHIAALQR